MPEKNNNKSIITIVIVIALLVVGVVMTNKKGDEVLTTDEAKIAAQTFINDILMQGNGVADIQEITEFTPKLYLLKINLEGSDKPIESYITADGKLFFPQSLDIEEMSNNDKSGSANSAPTANPDNAADSANPAPVANPDTAVNPAPVANPANNGDSQPSSQK